MPLPADSSFITTRWTRVRLAKADSDDGRRALAELCEAYYEPVVAWLRAELRDGDAARDMAHAFFARVLSGGAIGEVNQERGRFRAYLLGSVKHFLWNQCATQRAQKRGGGECITVLDEEKTAAVSDARAVSPDAEFDRQWALIVLGRALDALRAECAAEGKGAFFENAKPWLTGEGEYGDQAALAAECGMSSAAFKMAIQRLKARFRQCVKEEVAGTLESPEMVAEEMKNLFLALA